MITSAKNNSEKKKRTGRTLGQMVKANLYRQNHTYTLTKREKGENIYIYIYI